jgi:hypothetical protein
MAGHVAVLSEFTTAVIRTPSFETAGFTVPKVEKPADLLPTFDKWSQDARSELGHY